MKKSRFITHLISFMSFVKLDKNDFEFIRFVGRGTYSIISLQKYKKTGEIFAVKKFVLGDEDERYESDFMKEISILGTFHHPCIIGFHGFLQDEVGGKLELSYVLDYMEKGCLDDLLMSIDAGIEFPDFGPTEKSIIILGIACALRYMHYYAIKNGFVLHRDIKSGNILLDENFRPKLADFGFAKVISSYEPNTPRRGSYPWMAPEVMTSSKYGVKADVYSFGMLMYEIVVGKTPFGDFKSVADIVHAVTKKNARPPLPNPRLNIFELIEKCWSTNPDKRPDFNEIVPMLATETYILPGTDFDKYIEFASKIKASYPQHNFD